MHVLIVRRTARVMMRSLFKHAGVFEDCEETMKVGFVFANRVFFCVLVPQCEATVRPSLGWLQPPSSNEFAFRGGFVWAISFWCDVILGGSQGYWWGSW
jgi:hypothetical protein